MIGVIDIEIQAKNPNMPLWPLRAYVNSPSSLRLRNVPKKIGQWEITSVQVNVNYPDKTLKTAQCVLVGGVWVGTIEGSSATGSYTNGYTVLADGTDENGNPVSGYVLGRGDVEILKEDGTPIADDPTHFVTDDELDAAISSKAEISAVDDVANDLTDLSNSLSDYYTKSETSSAAEIQSALDGKQPTGDYALTSQLPTKTSELSNDSGYITSAQVEPAQTNSGFAQSAKNSGFLYNLNSGTIFDNLNQLALPDGQPTVESTRYYPWRLTKWFSDTFETPLQLEFKYISTIQVPLAPGLPVPTNKVINEYGWIGSSGQLTHYIIKAEKGGVVTQIYQPAAMGKFDSPQSDFLPITFSPLSIDTVNGQSGVVECTRENINTHTRRTLAFSDELSAKADLSALNVVESSLSDYYTKSETSSLIEDCWKNTDITISAENGFTIGQFNNVSADESEGVYLGKGAGLIEHGDGGALMLETTRYASQNIYDTAIITSKKIQQVSKRGNDEPVIHGSLIFPRNDGQNVTLASEEWTLEQLSAKADLSSVLPVSPYNTDLDSGYASFLAQINLTKPWDKPDLSSSPTLHVAAGSIGDNKIVFEVTDNTKNTLIVGFTEDGLPQIMYGWDDFYTMPDPRKLTYPEVGGTIATKEWVLEQLSALEARITALENS